jgi:hypothetical protein
MTQPLLSSHLLTRLPLSALDDAAFGLGGGPIADDLLARWRRAQTKAAELAEVEAECADEAAILPLPGAMARHVARVLELPELQRLHRLVPVAVGLVEVDALMSARTWMDESRVQAHSQRIGKRPPDSALARLCMPLRASERPVFELQPLAGGGLSISGHGAPLQWLAPPRLRWQADGPAARAQSGQVQLDLAAALVPPVMHALRYRNRLLLRRGHHRARALRAMGLAYLPCLISACVHLDEVRALAPELSDADCEHFFEASRPSLLRDFDRPSLVAALPMPRQRRSYALRVQITERWED